MKKNTIKEAKGSKIHEPLSSYYPPPFKVDEPTLQNFAPTYYGHGSIYVNKEEHQEKNES